jgi:outer membrane protein OmpA-like peptidoglycan-associated protein
MIVALALFGCASVTPPPAPSATSAASPPPVAPSAAEQKTEFAAALAVERKWLASWFEKTPVVIGQRSDGAVTIDVPRDFCFEPGRSAIKPALAAVLDKVAESMRRVPGAQLPLLAAPDDATGTAKPALQRSTEIRDHLRGRGVAATRLGKPSVTTAAAVQLRIEAAAPAP